MSPANLAERPARSGPRDFLFRSGPRRGIQPVASAAVEGDLDAAAEGTEAA
jgi:hypothetical protein